VSFLLDALRKSDARRRMGDSPDLNQTTHHAPGGRPGKRGKRRAGLLLVSLAVVAAVLAVAVNQERLIGQWRSLVGVESETTTPSEPAQPAQDFAAAETEPPVTDARPAEENVEQALPRERVVSDISTIDAELARRIAAQGAAGLDADKEPAQQEPEQPIDRRAPPTQAPRISVVAEPRTRTPQVAVDPKETERVERLLRAREARLAEMQAGEPGAETDTDSGADSDRTAPTSGVATSSGSGPAQPWSPTAAEYVRAWELPLSVRRNLPELRLTIHVYAAEVDQRFVLVNGERFVAGDMIASNVRLVEIRREGAVVDFRDYRFLLEP
jgi:general secretion pathway protein B